MTAPGMTAADIGALLELDGAHRTDPLVAVRQAINFSSLDWAAASDTAWIYGIVSGLDCEVDHEPNEICGGFEPMREMAAQHRWSAERVAQLRLLRTKWPAAQRYWHEYDTLNLHLQMRRDVEPCCGHVGYLHELVDTRLRVTALEAELRTALAEREQFEAESLTLLARLPWGEAGQEWR